MKIFAIEARDVSFTYEGHGSGAARSKVALDGMSLSVRVGQFHGLIGPNGAGKSTLIGLLVGTIALPAASREKVRVFGLPAGSHDLRAHIGYVPQGNALYPALSGKENLVLFGRMQGLSGRVAHARAADVLARLGLEASAGRACGHYSEGMKRRLNLGIALVHEPRLLVLDEPTAGVDPQSREHILTHLRELHENGTTLLFSTHLLEEPERVCEEITIVDGGKRVSVCHPSESSADGSGAWLREQFFSLTGMSFREEGCR